MHQRWTFNRFFIAVWRAKAAESGDANSPGVLASCGRTCSSPVVYQTVFWKTAEGKDALFSLTTGEDNTALGFRMIRNDGVQPLVEEIL